MNRRHVLASIGAVLTASIAGCGSTDSGDREEGTVDDSSGGSSNGDSGEETAGDSTEESSDGDNGEGSTDGSESESEQQIELLNHEPYSEEFSAGVRGEVQNVSGEVLSYVEVQVFFLDSDGTQIGEGLDNTSDLAADRRWEFDAQYLDTDFDRIDSYEIETDVSNF